MKKLWLLSSLLILFASCDTLFSDQPDTDTTVPNSELPLVIRGSGANTVELTGGIPFTIAKLDARVKNFDYQNWNSWSGAGALVYAPATILYNGENASVLKATATRAGESGFAVVMDALDTSAYKNIKIIYYLSAPATKLDFKVVGDGGEKEFIGLPNKTGWNTWETKTTAFSPVQLTAIKGIGFIYEPAGVGSDYLAWGDLYFYNKPGEATPTTPTTPTATEPTTAAATPSSRTASDVISLYSDAYTDVASNQTPGWGETVTEETIASDTVKKSSNFAPFDLTTAVDLSAFTHLHVDIWSVDGAQDILVKLVPPTGEADQGELTITKDQIAGQAWVPLEFKLSDFTGNGNFSLSSIKQVLVDQIPDAAVYMDNIYFYKMPSGGTPTTTEPTTAATAPTTAAANVISIYSDAYTDITGVNLNPDWGQSTTQSEETIGGGKAIKLANLNYQGIDFDGNRQNVSCLDKLHLDYWTSDATTFDVFVIADVEDKKTITATADGSWQSVDIDLSDYTTAAPKPDLYAVKQLKFVAADSPTIYLDNIYFYSSTGASTTCPAKPTVPTVPTNPPTTAAATPPTRTAANVISLFSDAYTDVPVATWSTSWDTADITDVTIASNAVKKVTFTNFWGVEFASNVQTETNRRLDLSTMTHMHIDFYADTTDLSGKVFNLKLSNWGATGTMEANALEYNINTGTTPAITSRSWVSADIALSSFSNNTDRDGIAQFIVTSNLTDVYVDNIYFYK